MPRPVKNNSTCLRYDYYRERYLSKKRLEKTEQNNQEVSLPEAMEAFLSLPVKSKRRVTWLELSRGRSNS